ncbi:MAG: DMT family transporter [Actinobacteria bacterium]|nr:DMT family transporter [Actinomycetota bacterium]
MSVRAAGLARVALLALIWGSGFLWIKVSLGGFSPVQLTLGRLALGALILVIVLHRGAGRLPTDRGLWRHLIAAALLANALPYLLFGIAEQHIESNLAGAITATTPLWTLAFALATRVERHLAPARALGLLLGFAGAVVILAPWQTTGASVGGAVACLSASASYGAGYVYMGRHLTGRGLPPLVLSAAQLITATGWLVIALPFGGLATPHPHIGAIIALLVLGAIGTGAAYVLNYRIITDDGPVLASTVTYLLPVVAVILGWLVLGEPITPPMTLGVATVLAGVALTRRRPAPTAHRTTPSEPADRAHQ